MGLFSFLKKKKDIETIEKEKSKFKKAVEDLKEKLENCCD